MRPLVLIFAAALSLAAAPAAWSDSTTYDPNTSGSAVGIHRQQANTIILTPTAPNARGPKYLPLTEKDASENTFNQDGSYTNRTAVNNQILNALQQAAPKLDISAAEGAIVNDKGQIKSVLATIKPGLADPTTHGNGPDIQGGDSGHGAGSTVQGRVTGRFGGGAGPAALNGGIGSPGDGLSAANAAGTPFGQDIALQAAKAADAEQRGDTTAAGQSRLQAGDPQAAQEDFARTLARDPKNADARAGLAVALAQQGHGEEAVETARQALAVDPHNALAGLIVGHADEIARGGAEAAKKLAKVEIGQFTDPGPLGAGAVFAGGATTGASGEAGAAAVVVPGRTGPQPEAPLYDTTLPLSSAQQLTLKALDMHKSGDDQSALLALTQAIDQDPQNAGAFVVRAEVENAMQSFPAAVTDAQKAMQLAPQNVPLSARALRAMAYAQLQTGDWTAALASASRSLELDSKSGLGYLYRGMAEDKLGRGDAAARDLAQAVTLDGSLQPLALPLLRKYGLMNNPLTAARPSSRVIRGGLIAGSLLLVLLGLLGTTTGRKAVTTAARSWRTGAPAAGPVAIADVRVGDSLGGYKILRELGRGGMGVVYEGLDETLQRRVAIKRMQTEQGADLTRFLREARLVAQLKHPHVAEIYNVLDAGSEPLLVFEFVDGRPLDAVLREARRLTAGRARRVVDDVCDALSYAHARGIIHRDLKPANVMVTPEGVSKVMDFGIAHQSTSGRTMTQTAVCGTPAYMAPEQGFGSVSKSSDLFALGVMAYELLTGARPFDGSDYVQAKMESRFTPVTELASGLPPGLNAFFARALASDPAKRFSSAAEFRDAFARALDGTPVPLA